MAATLWHPNVGDWVEEVKTKKAKCPGGLTGVVVSTPSQKESTVLVVSVWHLSLIPSQLKVYDQRRMKNKLLRPFQGTKACSGHELDSRFAEALQLLASDEAGVADQNDDAEDADLCHAATGYPVKASSETEVENEDGKSDAAACRKDEALVSFASLVALKSFEPENEDGMSDDAGRREDEAAAKIASPTFEMMSTEPENEDGKFAEAVERKNEAAAKLASPSAKMMSSEPEDEDGKVDEAVGRKDGTAAKLASPTAEMMSLEPENEDGMVDEAVGGKDEAAAKLASPTAEVMSSETENEDGKVDGAVGRKDEAAAKIASPKAQMMSEPENEDGKFGDADRREGEAAASYASPAVEKMPSEPKKALGRSSRSLCPSTSYSWESPATPQTKRRRVDSMEDWEMETPRLLGGQLPGRRSTACDSEFKLLLKGHVEVQWFQGARARIISRDDGKGRKSTKGVELMTGADGAVEILTRGLLTNVSCTRSNTTRIHDKYVHEGRATIVVGGDMLKYVFLSKMDPDQLGQIVAELQGA